MRIVKPIAITDSVLVSSTVPETDQPAYSNTVGYELKDKVMSTVMHKIYECIKQESSNVGFANATALVQVSWVKHGLSNGRMVQFTPVTGATFPGGVTANTTYYVVNSQQDTFNIASSPNGTPISLTTNGSGSFTCTSLVNGVDPTTNPTYWLDSGSTNRWKMFDKTVQSQTRRNGSITVKLQIPGYIDTIPLLNLTGNTVRVKIDHAASGTIYDRTESLVTNDRPVTSLSTYFFSSYKRRTDVVFTNIPPYANTEVTITITAINNNTVGIGAAIFGLARDISSAKLGVEQGAKISITDYSIKTRDAFGNYTITERAFANRANYTVYINNSELADIKNFLTSLRATPAVYIGGNNEATYIYGYYKSWEIDIAYPDFSVCSIELDGLT